MKNDVVRCPKCHRRSAEAEPCRGESMRVCLEIQALEVSLRIANALEAIAKSLRAIPSEKVEAARDAASKKP